MVKMCPDNDKIDQMAKIRPSKGCVDKATTTAAQFEYERHEFGNYPKNVI